MKRNLILLILGLASCVTAFPQGVIDFNISFGSNPPPHASGVPDSGARLTDDLFYAAIYLSDAQPTSGRIVETGGGGSLTTIFDFTHLVFAAYPPPPGATAFSYEQSWQLTAPQIQTLIAGQWYAEVSYAGSSYLGQIMPVPEPSSLIVFVVGLLAIAAKHWHPSRVRELLGRFSGGRFAKTPKRPPATFCQPSGLGTSEYIIAQALKVGLLPSSSVASGPFPRNRNTPNELRTPATLRRLHPGVRSFGRRDRRGFRGADRIRGAGRCTRLHRVFGLFHLHSILIRDGRALFGEALSTIGRAQY
jgi:hypothetical protein